jgi:hypothetical protein
MGNADYKISIQPDYVLVERPKDYKVVLGEMPAMLAEMSVVCEEAGCRKVMILGPKTKVNLDTLDIYDLGEQIAKMHLQIAIVESHDASDDDESFLETVVFNRGGPLQFFITEEEAKDWLRIS